jgi:hypothetical protein
MSLLATVASSADVLFQGPAEFVRTVHADLQALPSLPAAGDDGIVNWMSSKNGDVQTLLRGLAVTIGIGFVIWQGIESRGRLARIIPAGIGAGIFVWIVFNVTDLQKRVDDEVNSMRARPAPTVMAAAEGAPADRVAV